jgi:hypothetical protein
MSDGQTANFRRDGSAKLSARHAAVLEIAEDTVVAGHAVAVAGSDPVSVAVAALVAAADPGTAAAECAVAVAGPDPVSVVVPAAAYPDSASVAPAVAAYPDSASVAAAPAVAAYPDSAAVAAPVAAASLDSAADRAAVQDSRDHSRFAAGWGDPVCLSCPPAYRRVQQFQELTTTQLN